MALTLGHHLFGAIHEDAFNKFIGAYRAARPKYFFYACPPLGTGSPGTDFWILPPLPIPGTNSGMPFSVRILHAQMDFTPAQPGLGLPAPLTLAADQFALVVGLEVCILCGVLQRVSKPQGDDTRPNPNDPARAPAQNEGKLQRKCAKLSIWAIGHPLSIPNSHGGRDIGLRIDQIILKEVGALEPLLECYSEVMLNTLLDALRYPVEQFALGSFATLNLADGPVIADNQLKVWANIS